MDGTESQSSGEAWKVVWVHPGAKAAQGTAVRGAGGVSAGTGSAQDLRDCLSFCKKKSWLRHFWKCVGLYRCVLGANWRSTGRGWGETAVGKAGRTLSSYCNDSRNVAASAS